VAQLVEALHYKPEGCGFDSRWGYWDFLLTLSFLPYLRSTQSVMEMSTRDIPWGTKTAGA
jgi:hypothetical protein